MRKILVIIICLLAANSALAVSIIESGACGQGCAYTIDDEGNLKITGDGTGTISSQKFRDKRNFTNVDIKGIKNIESFAFLNAGSGGGTVKIDDSLRSMYGPFFW